MITIIGTIIVAIVVLILFTLLCILPIGGLILILLTALGSIMEAISGR